MLNNLLQSVNVVFPTVAMMALGWFLRRCGFLNESFTRTGTRLAFSVAFPCSIVSNFLGLEFTSLFNVKLLVYMMVGITLSMLIPLLVVPRFVKDRPTAASMVQAMFRPNFLIQGLPLLTAVYGEGNIGPGAFLLPFLILANNVLATVIFVTLIPEQREAGHAVVGALKKLAKNPLIIGSVLGVLMGAFRIRLPAAVGSTVQQIGRVGTPLALICMGADIRLDSIRGNLKYTLPTVLVRLVVIPVSLTLGAILLGFRGIELGSVFLFTATCTAAAGYVMSAAMGGNMAVSAESVGLSAVLFTFTTTAELFVLLQLGLI